MSILLILRISFLCYLDVINWAKSNTALNVINNPFLKKKIPMCWEYMKIGYYY